MCPRLRAAPSCRRSAPCQAWLPGLLPRPSGAGVRRRHRTVLVLALHLFQRLVGASRGNQADGWILQLQQGEPKPISLTDSPVRPSVRRFTPPAALGAVPAWTRALSTWGRRTPSRRDGRRSYAPPPCGGDTSAARA